MRIKHLVVASAAVVAVAAAGASAPAAAPPLLVLSATPTVVTLAGKDAGKITVINPGSRPVTVAVTRGNYDITRKGRVLVDPRVAPNRTAVAWISVSPSVLHLGPNRQAQVTVRSHPPRRAEPGDHHALVLLTAHGASSGQVGIRTRIGIGVLVRMPGEITRSLAVRKLAVRRSGRRRTFSLTLANGGNVNEFLFKKSVSIKLLRHGRVVKRLWGPTFDLLPAARVTKTFAYSGKLRGRFTASVTVRPLPAAQDGPGIGLDLAPITRTWRLRL